MGAASDELRARRWLAVGVVLAVVGAIVAIAVGGYHYAQLDDAVADFTRARAGQSAVIEIDQPVEWSVYVEPADAALRDVRWSISDLATGEAAEFGSGGTDFSYSVGEYSGRSLASVALEPGEYLLEVEGPQTIGVGPSQFGRLVWIWAGALGLGGVPLLIGVTMIIVASVRRARLRRLRGWASPAAG